MLLTACAVRLLVMPQHDQINYIPYVCRLNAFTWGWEQNTVRVQSGRKEGAFSRRTHTEIGSCKYVHFVPTDNNVAHFNASFIARASLEWYKRKQL